MVLGEGLHRFTTLCDHLRATRTRWRKTRHVTYFLLGSSSYNYIAKFCYMELGRDVCIAKFAIRIWSEILVIDFFTSGIDISKGKISQKSAKR